MKKKKYEYIQLLKTYFKWVILSTIMGIPIGIIVSTFDKWLSIANKYRSNHKFMILFLPLAGVAISYMYIHTKRNAYSGENLLKAEVQNAAKDIPIYMIPVVFTGSLLTTLFGGSAGKEGAAVAIGGTFADFISRLFQLNDDEQKILVISGVGSSFGLIYDVPFAGAILGMELVLKKRFNYQALIPAFLTSVIANEVGNYFGRKIIRYPSLKIGNLTFIVICKLVLLGVMFGLLGMIFNYALDNSGKVYSKFIKSPLIKGFVGGVITIILFLILGEDYNGLGTTYIINSFTEPAYILDFFWKIIFTAVALGSVFQGGRGNPIFFVGATFGSAIASYVNLPIKAVTALGMIGAFCSATSLPITSIIMSLEYFGSNDVLAIIIVMTISYFISGFYDIFSENNIEENKKDILEGKI